MNDGFINEKELKNYINGKVFCEFSENIKKFLTFVFDNKIDESKPFEAVNIKQKPNPKPDLSITHNGITKYISVKKGAGNSIHQENIEEFFPYFESLFGTDALLLLKLFHYGDDTVDDSGVIRYKADVCKKRYKTQIEELNSITDSWEQQRKLLDRFIFVGNVSELTVDVVYHGTILNGVWASQEEIISYFEDYKKAKNAVHFKALTYQAWGRNEKFTAKYPDRRYVMQIKWGDAEKDLTKIRELNDNV